MICIKTQYFSLNRILLLAIGLWPYDRSKLVRLQATVLLAILGSFIVFQLTTFMIAECTADLVIKVLSWTMVYVTFVIKYNSFLVNSKAVKSLMEQLQYICNELKDENEIAIINKYGNNAKIYTIGLTLFIMCTLFVMVCLPLWPLVLDILLPINESRPHPTLYIVTEYFLDEEKYFYLILLHMNAACCIGWIAMVATGTTLIAYLKHACGMFMVASYRIEQAMEKVILQDLRIKNEAIAYREIINAVDIHRKAIKFCEFLNTSFEGSFFLLVAVGVACLSLNIFRVMSFGDDLVEILVHVVIILAAITYMFLPNYFGQEVMDHNNHIFLTAYNVSWYRAPLSIQRLILVLLQRGNKEFTLGVGGLVVASLKNFATLTSTSVSYFTVIYSMQ